jgi:eukaryotic-like serine/threonine-protein kinase
MPGWRPETAVKVACKCVANAISIIGERLEPVAAGSLRLHLPNRHVIMQAMRALARGVHLSGTELSAQEALLMPANCADRNLLVGLVALQNGLINQAQLVAAFQEWSLEKGRALVDHLVSFGHLNDAQRAVVEALADLHVMKHGDVEQSLAAIPAGPSTRKRLAQLGDLDIERSLARQGLAATAVDEDSDLTANYSVGSATSDGQRFRVLRPHAHGGLGAVFVALDAELHREVALKQILDSHADEPTSRQRFVLEAEVTGGLEHPGIVPVYGMGTYGDGRPYYAMRFIRGGSLKEAIDRFHNDQALKRDLGRRSLELRKLLRRFSDVCNAIDYAHSRGVLHRDIKPGNIIVGKHGETLVVDWGLAKVTGRSDPVSGERALLPSSASGSAETLPGSALGTPAYMSPEQAEGNVEHLGPRSDVYSLGATLYYLLTGRPPVEGNVASVLRAVQQGDFKPPRHVDATIDGALEAVCQKAMARRPDDRYASPLALVEDVERWMADERVLAWREPLARRARRWAKRNRTAVTAAGVALLALVTGLSAVLAVQTKAKADVTKAFRREANANSALAAANAELTRSKMAVQARYELAVEAIKTFHTGVSEDFMMKQDRFKDLRNKLLMSASDFYGKLGALLREATDLPSRRALLAANFEVAGLAVRVGRQADALAMQSTVLASRQALAREAGAMNEAGLDVTALQLDVAISHRALGGTADALGKRDEALSAYNAALAVLKPLAAAHPDRTEIQHEMAATQGDIALHLTEAHRPAEALAALESVLPIFEKLATAEPDNRRSIFSIALSRFKMAGQLHEMNRLAEAQATYEAAQAAWQKLSVSSPDYLRFRVQSALADCHLCIAGIWWESGKREQAGVAIDAALVIFKKMVEAFPADTQAQQNLARGLREVGAVRRENGKTAEALVAFEQALTTMRRLAEANPEVVAFQSALASDYAQITYVQKSMGRTAEALTALKESLSILRKLSEAHPNMPDYQRELGRSLNYSGELHASAGQLSDALASFEQARELHERLVRDYPHVRDYRAGLQSSLAQLGQVLRGLGKPAEAEAQYRKALALARKLVDDNPTVRDYHSRLETTIDDLVQLLAATGKDQQREGQTDKAESSFRAASAVMDGITTLPAKNLVDLACCQALLAGVGGKTGSDLPDAELRARDDRAIDALRRAIASGYRDFARLRTDTDLDRLRSRADFQLLMLDVAFPGKPFVP